MLGWVFRYRGWLLSPLLIVALVWPGSAIAVSWSAWPVGTGTVLLGVALRIWAQQHIRHRLKVPMQFTTTGPFQFVRNPLYIGNTLLWVGAAFASKVLWLVPTTFFWCLGIYSLVTRHEEAQLQEIYGEPYRRYLAEVPRWLPRARASGLRFGNLGLVNEYFGAALRAELHCLLILLPFILKEFAPRWLGR